MMNETKHTPREAAMIHAIKLAHENLRPTKSIKTSEGFSQHLAWAELGKVLHAFNEYPGVKHDPEKARALLSQLEGGK